MRLPDLAAPAHGDIHVWHVAVDAPVDPAMLSAGEHARATAFRQAADRNRFVANLTSIEDCTKMALAVGRDAAQPSLCFADVADNPGGGARGNTTWLLKAFHKAGVEGA